ncbi:GDP-L-fucose synthase family protein [Lentilitoribacter sp. EG35]|uniref:GDP-L-fucose synthase family protein n=1 Tax=Lentilitoribacter sp. EG35 TaxID=3234192 RepID=UPI0034607741
MTPKSKIFIAGHNGMVGSAIYRKLRKFEGTEFKLITRSRIKLDLTDQAKVRSFFESEKPDQIYLAAAKVGGIHANDTYPAEFIYQNLMIQNNIIESAFQTGVKKLLFLGSSCIYPKLAAQPITEDEILKGKLEPTNEPYAIAKIAGIKMCESYNRQYGLSHGIDYRSLMPTNLYGPGDNYHPDNSHVIPGLIHRFHTAKVQKTRVVNVWGSGNVLREFLHVDDLADASIYFMNMDQKTYGSKVHSMQNHINIGSGQEYSIKELAILVSKVIGFNGEISFDSSKPDGSPRKLLDISLAECLGWRANIGLQNGIKKTYHSFLEENGVAK